ncbi:MAG: RNA polymerase sigma factor [Lachnospiraceae bacterium]|nr:RNA polymerase sigma factor [Lachnospiraceae bacterium]
MEYGRQYSETLTLEQDFIDDNQLIDEYIEGVANRDKKSFEELYEMTKGSVYGYALSMLKNIEEAQDILHDVYLKIYENAHKYRSNGKPLAWIFTITRNEILMKLRKQKTIVDIDELRDVLETNKRYTVEDKVILEMLFKEMSDIERNILLLHVVTGYKFHEIARFLRMPTPTVITKYNRLIKKIRKVHSKEHMYEG